VEIITAKGYHPSLFIFTVIHYLAWSKLARFNDEPKLYTAKIRTSRIPAIFLLAGFPVNRKIIFHEEV